MADPYDLDQIRLADLPYFYQSALAELRQDLDEGDITQKGYEKKRRQILLTYLRGQQHAAASARSDLSPLLLGQGRSDESPGRLTPAFNSPAFSSVVDSPAETGSGARFPLPDASPRSPYAASGLDFDALLHTLGDTSSLRRSATLAHATNREAGLSTAPSPCSPSDPSPPSPTDPPPQRPSDPPSPHGVAPILPPANLSPPHQVATPLPLDPSPPLGPVDPPALAAVTPPPTEVPVSYSLQPYSGSSTSSRSPPRRPPRSRQRSADTDHILRTVSQRSRKVSAPHLGARPTTVFGAAGSDAEYATADELPRTIDERDRAADAIQLEDFQDRIDRLSMYASVPSWSEASSVALSPCPETSVPDLPLVPPAPSRESARSVSPSRARKTASATGLRVVTRFTPAARPPSPPEPIYPAPGPPRQLRVTNYDASSSDDDAGPPREARPPPPPPPAPAPVPPTAAPRPPAPAVVPVPATAPAGSEPAPFPTATDTLSSMPSINYFNYKPAVTAGRPRTTSVSTVRTQPEPTVSEPNASPGRPPPFAAFAGRVTSHAVARDVPAYGYGAELKYIMSTFPSLPALLRYRAARTPKAMAFLGIDNRGREGPSVTWLRLLQRAERVGKLLRTKGVVCKGDRVALVYRKSEVVDFLVAFYAVLGAGLCAVPLVATDSLAEMIDILNVTQTRVVLTTDLNIKALTRDLASAGVPAPGQGSAPAGWPADIEWVKTNDLGGSAVTYHPANPSSASLAGPAVAGGVALQAHDLAYLEFSKSPNGELKGVQVTHGSIMQQCLAATLQFAQLADEEDIAQRASSGAGGAADDEEESLPPPRNRSFDVNPAGDANPTAYRHSVYGAGTLPARLTSSRARLMRPFGRESTGSALSLRRSLGASLGRNHLPPIVAEDEREEDEEEEDPDALDTPSLDAESSGAALASGTQAFLVSLDPRQHTGLLTGGLLGAFGGHRTFFLNASALEVPGVWVHTLSKYGVTVAVADYPSLGHVLSSAIDEPDQIANFNRRVTPNLRKLNRVLIECLYIEPAFQAQFNRAVLHPFGCPYKSIQHVQRRAVLTPLLTLPEHGSILLSTRNCFDDPAAEEATSTSTVTTAASTTTTATAATEQTPLSGAGADLFTRVIHARDALRSRRAAPFREVWEFTLDRRALRRNRVVVTTSADDDRGEVGAGSDRPASRTDRIGNADSNDASANGDSDDDVAALVDQVLADMGHVSPEGTPLAAAATVPSPPPSVGPPAPTTGPRVAPAPVDTVTVYSFGRPAFLTNVVIVNPNTKELCAPDEVGELWVDCPALGAGFWALPKLSQAIFYARYRYYLPDGEAASDQTFLRTGLMGTLIDGCLVVLGVFEDRLQQTLAPAEPTFPPIGPPSSVSSMSFAASDDEDDALVQGGEPDVYFHYRRDVLQSLRSHLSLVGECTAFELFVNDTYLPVFLFETRVSEAEMPRLCEDVYRTLVARHRLYAYAVCACGPDALPRAYEYGRRVVNAHLCQTRFEKGAVAIQVTRLGLARLALPSPHELDDSDLDDDNDDANNGMDGSGEANRWLQHTSLELSLPSTDERTGRDLQQFATILEVLHWRATVTPTEPAVHYFEGRKRASLLTVAPTNIVSFNKLVNKIAALAHFLTEKHGVRPGDHVVAVLPAGLDLFYSVHACFAVGAVLIPLPVPEAAWETEDALALADAAAQFNARHLLVDAETDLLLKQRPYVTAARGLHRVHVAKCPKPGGLLGNRPPPPLPSRVRAAPGHIALVLAHPPGPDDAHPQFVKLTHANLLAGCRQLKSDFQMPAGHPVLATTRAYCGYAFLQFALLGIFTGCTTVLLTYADFCESPHHWFELLQRYKVKDALATYPMFERAVGRLHQAGGRAFSLHNLRNLSVVLEDRALPAYYTSLAGYFMSNRLEETAINNLYAHPMNPVISTRAYMGIKPVTLRLDLAALRRGQARVTGTDRSRPAVVLQDSGKVASNAMVAVVDPATKRICAAGAVGEIWVYSVSNAGGYSHRRTGIDPATGRRRPAEVTAAHLLDHIAGGDPQYAYVRTGDLGFLYIDPSSGTGVINGVPEEPLLYVAGRLADTFRVRDLLYFVPDVELTVERAHPLIENNGTVAFRTSVLEPPSINHIRVHNNFASIRPPGNRPPRHDPASRSRHSLASAESSADPGGIGPPQHFGDPTMPAVAPVVAGPPARERLVVVASVLRYTETDICHVANLAPLVVNALLQEHRLVPDELIFIPAASIPKSRTHEKRRSWVQQAYEEGPINVLSRHVMDQPY